MPIPTRRRPSIAAFRPCVRVLAGVIAVACGAGCEAQSPGLSGFFMRPLPIVDATRERDGTLVRVEMPSGGVPALVRVGKPPTPASVAGYGATRDTVVVAIYESLSDLQLLAINKASGDVTTLTCDGSSLTKYVRPDVASPRIAWIPTSLSPALFRFDERSSTVTKVLDVPGETHVLAFDQSPDG
ncbi:MAG: hypothetical protein KDA25_01615, partial [Phycisphaerales bacterium]|nr:hypothetical protein [Phycisphaerales bacterium]